MLFKRAWREFCCLHIEFNNQTRSRNKKWPVLSLLILAASDLVPGGPRFGFERIGLSQAAFFELAECLKIGVGMVLAFASFETKQRFPTRGIK